MNSSLYVASKPALRFVHLRVHSAYSLLEGALQVPKVIDLAVANKAPAIAITDTNNLFGALEFAQKGSKAGLQPIIGCQLDIAFHDQAEESRSANRREALGLAPLVLLAATEAGYANLVRLVSRAYLETPAGDPVHITSAWLKDRTDGIIALSGGPEGPIAKPIKDDRIDRARQRLNYLKSLFGDRLYVELQRHRGYDRALEAAQVELAYELEL
ncbi:PHP domain-containing protein, partial [Phyllobacterium sp. P5_D12]